MGAIEFSVNSGNYWTPYNYASGATADYTNEAATDLVGWYSVNSGGATNAVGGLAANALGIYDMSGNAWEWCWDWYGTYPTTATANYTGSAGGAYRVMRGGSYSNTAINLQVGIRAFSNPYYTDHGFGGFRFVRTN
jgi:sulfatase modifying factor 1